MLVSVFEHLLSNAATHTDRPTANVTVAVEATDDRTSVTIADDGYGMADAQKAAVADPDTDDRAAIGAGLYFVRTVLDSAGGDLAIEDNHPRGTVVTVTLDRITNPDR